MSINWVMLSETEGFVRLPNEHLIYTSPPRTSLSLKPPSSYSGKESFSIHSSSGCIYLTNQRIVYLPSQPNDQLQSFTAPLLNIHDSHVSAPFFGPNVWTAIVQPVSGGGIPPSLPVVELKVTFKEGGAFDFHSNFERIKDRLQQAVEHARESGLISGNDSQPLAGAVDFSNVHLDELPAYEGPSDDPPIPAYPGNSHDTDIGVPPADASKPPPPFGEEREGAPFEPPTEPPPGYEEVQQQSVAHELENQLRRGS
ncbi:hypothetical protein VTN77DRAFT_6119 [Rasamsonia byssochlamydoides]|uniref:uncharacterized protein n=1 Tax=Rasamsonia byssochlamydoides TaxID=89139 RepID=UPI003743BE87